MAFVEGQKVHMYICGYELYEATVTKVDAKSMSVQYSGGQGERAMSGTLNNIDLQKMYYDDTDNAPVPTAHPDLKGIGEDNDEIIIAEYDLEFPDDGYDDMTDMRKLNDCELARSLRHKFFKNECFCNCGPTLVAVNLKLPGSSYGPGGEREMDYHQDTLAKYADMKDRHQMPPHAWNLASSCWQALFLPLQAPATSHNQAIVITGESGAGKSFQTKKMLDFLAYVGADPGSDPNEATITDRMLSTTPILEGFGNACMPRNPDSSRFGKLYKVFFDTRTKLISGCEIENYMLEKSRVASQQIFERNYHMFYRMVLGGWGAEPRTKKGKVMEAERLAADGMSKYEIRNIMHYNYLKGGIRQIPEYEVIQDKRPAPASRQNMGFEAEDFEDREKMGETYAAMKPFFSEETIDSILSNTMGVLWMGNIEITGGTDSSEVVDTGKSKEAIDAVAKLFKVDRAELKDACNTKSLNIMKKWTQTKLGKDAALALRDAIAKTVYEKQFDFIVEKCSQSLLPPNPDGDVWLGVLDIFGFEHVETNKITPFVDKKGNPTEAPNVNSFEQFCINLCNEQLQGHFVDVIFTLEQQLYIDQFGSKIAINFTLNDDTIDLIVDRKTGIINYLDEVARNIPKQGDPDEKFYEKIKKAYGTKNKRIEWPPTKGRSQYYGQAFDLDHYAAKVRYDTKNWVSKDADETTHDTYVCLGKSADEHFLSVTFSEDMENKSTGPACIGGSFKNKLALLISTLKSADSQFVRCIKCSNPLVPGKFTAKEVLNQLKYTGMLDTLKIRRAGFAMRLSYQQFMDDYHVLDVNAENHTELVTSIQKNLLPKIIQGMAELPSADQQNPDGTWDAIRVGKKGLIMARDWLDRELDKMRREVLSQSAVIIQATYRASAEHIEYTRQQGAWSIQAACRAVSAKKPYHNTRMTVLKAMPEMHAFTGRVIASRAADTAGITAARNEMNAFNEDNRRLEKMEADERKMAMLEDEYSWKLMDATFALRVDGDKKQYLTMADTAYKTAIERMASVKEFIDTTAKKGSEADARWQKMQTEGVVRAVPLVRQYKTEAVPFQAPSKDAYRFKYSFSYKGAKAVASKDATVAGKEAAAVEAAPEEPQAN